APDRASGGPFRPPADQARDDSVHVDRLAVWVRGGQRRRDPHRHADAAVTGRVRRYRRVAVDRVAAGEVHRVEQRAERARVEAVFAAGAQPGAVRALAATTILPGLLVSIGTETTLRPPTVAAAAPGRRTVTAIVPDEAGRRRTSARRFPYSSCLPANDTVSMGRTTSAKGADVARSAV